MPLSIEEKKSIIAYRVQKADSVFIEASDNATMNHWNVVANRLYYAVFDMFDWAEEDVKPLFNRTELLIKKMKSLLSLVE